jgi:hypothetical protein
MGNNPVITKAWLLEALSDREWHPQYQLINRALGCTKPEQMSRNYYEKSRRKEPTETDVNKAIYYGTKSKVQAVLSSLYSQGLIEYRGEKGSTERESRFIGWYCWNCGRVASSEKPANGQCGNCPIHCWNCGRVIEHPKLRDDELCDICQEIHDDTKKRVEIINKPDEVKPQPTKPQPKKFVPVTLRFPKIEQEPESESEEPKQDIIADESDGDIGDTLVYRSSLRPRKRKRRAKAVKPEKTKPPKPEKPAKSERKPRKSRSKVIKEVEIPSLLKPDSVLLLTYDPGLQPANVCDLSELMGVAVVTIKRSH